MTIQDPWDLSRRVADAMARWSAEADRRWRESKFHRLWAEKVATGRDPRAAFAARGWES